ncbi:hypothetical protein [Mucilaginibacter antarcticus]|uniref:hypothetical protein n=1 Tax=Mucilaginibacter antarcticus TaxID=1855725 RepID=UPI0036258927
MSVKQFIYTLSLILTFASLSGTAQSLSDLKSMQVSQASDEQIAQAWKKFKTPAYQNNKPTLL